MDKVKEEIEFVLARHGMPASRDRIAMGILIDHTYEKLCRELWSRIEQTLQTVRSFSRGLFRPVRNKSQVYDRWTMARGRSYPNSRS